MWLYSFVLCSTDGSKKDKTLCCPVSLNLIMPFRCIFHCQSTYPAVEQTPYSLTVSLLFDLWFSYISAYESSFL